MSVSYKIKELAPPNQLVGCKKKSVGCKMRGDA
jgi:hypothetical protein